MLAHSALIAVFFATAISLIGCGPEATTSRDRGWTDTSPSTDLGTGTVRRAPLRTARVRASVVAMGAVPNDRQTVPIVSPDGRWIATQVGVTPTWDTVLARPGAEVPRATRIEVFRLGWGQEPPVLVHAINEPVMLGRSRDAQGFLVESVRDDGARWIGKASWTSGEIDWLVQDSNINAFAALGRAGQLAWSRRAPDTEHFELVVRTPSSEWTRQLPGADVLMPTWSGRGDSLFVLSLQNGFLDALFGNASSEIAFGQSMRRLPLATEAYDRVAYQTTVIGNGQDAAGESFIFWHPFKKRIAVWQPYSETGNEAVLSRQRSIAGLLDDDGHMLIVAEGDHRPELYRHALGKPLDSNSLLAGIAIPRTVRRGPWSYVLLAPNESGMVGITGMQLLPDEDAADIADPQR